MLDNEAYSKVLDHVRSLDDELRSILEEGHEDRYLIADDIGQVTPAAEIPLAWIYVVPLVGFLLAALRSGLALFVDVREVAGRPEAAP